MFRKLAVVAIFVMLLSIVTAGFSSQASTCQGVAVTVNGQRYHATLICWNIPQAPSAAQPDVAVPAIR